jgi:hypothetical protein
VRSNRSSKKSRRRWPSTGSAGASAKYVNQRWDYMIEMFIKMDPIQFWQLTDL